MQSAYEKDYFAWTKFQAALLREGKLSELDMYHLAEEIEDLGSSKYSKLESYLSRLFCHLLKIEHQPKKHTRSWDLTIEDSRYQISKILRKNPSLKHYLDEAIEEAYKDAIIWASDETNIDMKEFPTECPWKKEEFIKE